MLIRFHFPLTLGILYLLRAWLRKWYMVEKWVSRAMRLAEDHSWTRQFSDFPDFVERSCIVPAFHCNAPWRLSNIIRLQVPEESDGRDWNVSGSNWQIPILWQSAWWWNAEYTVMYKKNDFTSFSHFLIYSVRVYIQITDCTVVKFTCTGCANYGDFKNLLSPEFTSWVSSRFECFELLKHKESLVDIRN